jgi:DNA-binding SARP family transcriptional activator
VLGVRALGGSRISVAGRTIDASAWGYAKPRELLHFLLVHPPSGKGAIGTALWPDADQQALRGAFHTTLNRLRRVIGAERVVYAGGRYSIDPGRPLESDVAAFRQALRDAKADPEGRERHLRAAVQAYRGEYLAGEAPGEWVVPVREQLQRSAERALLELGHLLLERDDAPAAVPAFRRALELDPLLESAHRGLMQAQVRLGEPARALRQFEVLRRTLRAELRADPAPGTTALAHRIRVVASR